MVELTVTVNVGEEEYQLDARLDLAQSLGEVLVWLRSMYPGMTSFVIVGAA